ncbi:nuclear transport factor 2 family protein [Flavobacterium sp. IMCC34518]|uniref:nuclear transport factor 2 family protein n=1 Tax=Flavobacterium sp. IMCC34518 TaxID=3003623 RepID=UPI00248244EF|nr:nuclear transport factor 2 family protein [Flavobacterium sp. IMCC34518]
MKEKIVQNQVFFLLFLLIIGLNLTQAQEKKVAPTSQELYNEIAAMDTVLFDAFNAKDMAKFKPLFTEDLEWYQDNGGLLSYETVFTNFEKMFKNENKLTRQLVKGSLEVHPIKDFGAIEIGVHQFRHMENGKEEIGTFKFVMIWKKVNNQWKLSRVISYDH